MSTEVQAVVKVESRLDSPVKAGRSVNVQANLKKPKGDDGKFKFSKKRSQIFPGGKMFPPYKKRKKDVHMPPTKFLLGGNIRDPLNLNSFQDEEINRRMNAVTPESSPLPTPQHRKGEIEVIIPPNINDPLSLAGGEEDNDAYAASFLSTPVVKRVKKKNKKKRQRSSTGSGKEDNADFKSDESKSDEIIEQDLKPEEIEIMPVKEIEEVIEIIRMEEERPPVPVDLPIKPETLEIPVAQMDISISKEIKKIKPIEKESPVDKSKQPRKMFDMKDKIVSPVVPQPGARAPPHRFRPGTKQPPRPAQNTPNFKEKNKRFQFGNYNRYYGYRNPGHEVDPRLKLFAKMNLFEGKDVLDIGCNTGHVTISIARDFKARKVVGLDIDKGLIDAAKANIRKKFTKPKNFPVSMPLVYGSLEVPGIPSSEEFPYNVSFIQGNYVLESDVLLDMEHAQFDVILCLSVTKWMHLNWGDDGLKRAFARMFSQLRPGGVLVLEPQSWSSYKNKKNITETMWRNYSKIKLLPAMFTEHLLTDVGFSKCDVIGAPFHPVKAFQRPIKMYTKAKGSETPSSTGQTPKSTIVEIEGGQIETENLS